MPNLPPRSDGPPEIRKEELKAFFENMDEACESKCHNSVYNDNRQMLEKRLRDAVGLTMPFHRYR